jgi:hypothetical protein
MGQGIAGWRRLVVLIGLTTVVPACGGGGGGSDSGSPHLPTVLFSDDYSELNVSNWTGYCSFDGLFGNPAPSMIVKNISARSVLQFSFVDGLTVSFDCNCNGANYPSQFFAGISDLGGPTGEGSGFVLWSGSATVYFNNTTPSAVGLSGGWHNYKMVILPGTHFVEWYIDGTLQYTSTAAINVPSPQNILFANNNSTNLNVDNVVVTTP